MDFLQLPPICFCKNSSPKPACDIHVHKKKIDMGQQTRISNRHTITAPLRRTIETQPLQNIYTCVEEAWPQFEVLLTNYDQTPTTENKYRFTQRLSIAPTCTIRPRKHLHMGARTNVNVLWSQNTRTRLVAFRLPKSPSASLELTWKSLPTDSGASCNNRRPSITSSNSRAAM